MTKAERVEANPVEVSFVTVNYRQSAVTLALLESLQTLSMPHWECFVVDNGGHDTDLQTATTKDPRLHFISSSENLGFAGGNNLALPYCRGRYIFFINNDTEVTPGLLEPLIAMMDEDRTIGMLSPKIVFDYDRKTLQFTGYSDFSLITMRNHDPGSMQPDEEKWNASWPTAFVHGAAMMVPRRIIDEVGPMSEEYFLYMEEFDWSLRIRKAGYKLMYFGGVTVYHKESVSTGANSSFKIYYINRNRILLARKHLPGWRSFLFMLYFATIVIPVHMSKHLVKGEWTKAKAYISALKWNLSKQL